MMRNHIDIKEGTTVPPQHQGLEAYYFDCNVHLIIQAGPVELPTAKSTQPFNSKEHSALQQQRALNPSTAKSTQPFPPPRLSRASRSPSSLNYSPPDLIRLSMLHMAPCTWHHLQLHSICWFVLMKVRAMHESFGQAAFPNFLVSNDTDSDLPGKTLLHLMQTVPALASECAVCWAAVTMARGPGARRIGRVRRAAPYMWVGGWHVCG